MYMNTGFRTQPATMGFWDQLVGAAIGAGGGGASGGVDIPGGGMAPPSNTATTVSPTFQQDFNAQVSPVISPVIGSPGATTSGTPVQVAPGGQTARGGGTTQIPQAPTSSYFPGGGAGVPGVAPLSLPSLANSSMQQRFNVDDYLPRGLMPTDQIAAQKGFDINKALPWMIGGAIVVTGLLMFAPRRKKAA